MISAALRRARDEATRWPQLDGIRGFAIVAVVAYHAFKLLGHWTSARIRGDGVPVWGWALGGGRLGVDLFFVLSGFLLWFSWRSLRRRQPRLGPALRQYARGRAIRLLPPYYLMLAVYVPLLEPSLLTSLAGLWDLGLFATLQQYNEPLLPNRLNVPLWSLTTEVHFYVLLPLVAVLARRHRAVLAVALTLAIHQWWVDARGVYPLSFIPGRLDQFTAGMAAASLVQSHLDGVPSRLARFLASRPAPWLLGVPLAGLVLYHGSTLGLPRDAPLDRWTHPLVGLALAGIVAHLVLAERSRGLLSRPVPRLLGHLSYGMYLWHFPILEWARDWGQDRFVGTPLVGSTVSLVVGLAVVGAVSVAAYGLVERPTLERKTRSALSRS